LKKQGIRGENGRRLQAIISAREHGIKAVAEIYNISRETLMRWIRKFKAGGSPSFSVAKGRGRSSKLSETQKLEIKGYIEKTGAQLSSKKLQSYIEERFAISVSKSTSHRLLQNSGFSYITPRPSHYKKNPQKQEEFKKKSTNISISKSRL
jgi:transposase